MLAEVSFHPTLLVPPQMTQTSFFFRVFKSEQGVFTMSASMDPGFAMPRILNSSFRLCFSSLAMPFTWLTPSTVIFCFSLPHFTLGNSTLLALLPLFIFSCSWLPCLVSISYGENLVWRVVPLFEVTSVYPVFIQDLDDLLCQFKFKYKYN